MRCDDNNAGVADGRGRECGQSQLLPQQWCGNERQRDAPGIIDGHGFLGRETVVGREQHQIIKPGVHPSDCECRQPILEVRGPKGCPPR